MLSKHFFSIGLLLALVFGIGMGAIPARAESSVLYAAPTAVGSGNCSDWANACTLQTALTIATSGDEIWVKAGVHLPTTDPADRAATFTLKNSVALYGGFAGTETGRDQRDWTINSTILSGDIDGNDTNADGNFIAETSADIQGDNACHVVTGGGTNDTAVLDGFTVTAGHPGGNVSYGGGMYNYQSSPTLANVTFSGNYAYSGGGMYNSNSDAKLTNVTFSGNFALYDGGGMANIDSNPTLTNIIFYDNDVDYSFGGITWNGGGGMNNRNSNPMLTNITFFGNSSSDSGGGMYNSNSNPVLTNVNFSGNAARYYGGGMYNSDNSSPVLVNTTLFSNLAARYYGGGIYNQNNSNPTLVNCILWGDRGAFSGSEIYNDGSTPTVTFSDVQGGYPGAGNINADPRFVDSMNGSLRPRGNSPVVDAGNNAAVPPGVTTDRDGKPRIVNTVDMGAYEYQGTDFSDVPPTYWAWEWIERLYWAGVTSGCGTDPLIYCPEDRVTRAQTAIFLERGMNGATFVPPTGTGMVFGDVPDTYWAMSWIEKLFADGITAGCGGGNYCPDDPVTRAQMAIFLLRSKYGAGYTPPMATGTMFTDVPTSYWAADWIEQLATEGITGGCGTNLYCPDDPVTRAQMAVFLVRTFNLP